MINTNNFNRTLKTRKNRDILKKRPSNTSASQLFCDLWITLSIQRPYFCIWANALRQSIINKASRGQETQVASILFLPGSDTLRPFKFRLYLCFFDLQPCLKTIRLLSSSDLEENLPTWSDDVLHRLVDSFLAVRFPILLVLNKSDISSSSANIEK